MMGRRDLGAISAGTLRVNDPVRSVMVRRAALIFWNDPPCERSSAAGSSVRPDCGDVFGMLEHGETPPVVLRSSPSASASKLRRKEALRERVDRGLVAELAGEDGRASSADLALPKTVEVRGPLSTLRVQLHVGAALPKVIEAWARVEAPDSRQEHLDRVGPMDLGA